MGKIGSSSVWPLSASAASGGSMAAGAERRGLGVLGVISVFIMWWFSIGGLIPPRCAAVMMTAQKVGIDSGGQQLAQGGGNHCGELFGSNNEFLALASGTQCILLHC